MRALLTRLILAVVLTVSGFAGTGAPFAAQTFQGISDPRSYTGLQAWYDVSDVSSMLNNGGATPTNGQGVKLVSDKSGNSSVNVLCLNGVAGNYASAATATAFGTADFTVSAKLRVNSLAATGTILHGGANSFSLTVLLTTGTLQTGLPTVGNNTASTGALVALTEYVVTYVRSGTTGTYYINGVSAGTTTDSRNYSVASRFMGMAADGTSAGLVGNIEWVHAYSVALDSAGIAADMTGAIQANSTFDVAFSSAAKLATSFTATTGGTVTINTSGATGARISGARDLYQGTAANQPIYLPWSGTNYGWTNGVAANYFSAPDAAFASTELEVVARVQATDWTPGTAMIIAAKYGAAGQRSFYFGISATTGTIFFGASNDGTAVTNAISSVGTGFTDGGTYWVKMTWRASDGRTQFFTAADSSSEPSFSQLGTDQTGLVANMFDSTTVFEVGAYIVGTQLPWVGNLYSVALRTSIDGANSKSFTPSSYSSGTTFVAPTGEVWTLNGGATIVTRSTLYFDGSNDYLKAAAFALSQPETVYFVGSQVTWTSADVIYNGDATGTQNALYQTTGSPQAFLFSGSTVASTGSNWPLTTNAVITSVYNGASSSNRVNRLSAATGNAGTNASNGFTLGASFNGGSPANITASEVLVYSTADATAQQNAVIGYLARKWSISGGFAHMPPAEIIPFNPNIIPWKRDEELAA